MLISGSEFMIITFSKTFYNLKAINSAIKEYANLGKFNVSDKKNEIAVTIKNIDKDVEDVLKDEFCNYVLALMKK